MEFIYIIYIYLLLLLLYNSFILDIEHPPYYIALVSTQTHKVIEWQPILLWYIHVYIYIYIYMLSNLADWSQGRPEGPLFNSYYTEIQERAVLLSPDWSPHPWFAPYNNNCVLSKVVTWTIFKVFGMTRLGIEPRSRGLLANTLPIGKWAGIYILGSE